MTGDAGTGKSGQVYSYYICNGRRAKVCNKARAAKQQTEDAVIAALADVVNDDDMISAFADRYMLWQKEQLENGTAAGLEKQLKRVETAIQNVMSIIDGGLITDSIKSHLVDLESERVALESGVAKAKMEEPELDRKSVVWFLKRFRTADMTDISWRIYIVETFLQAAYLYDDGRLLLHLNMGGDDNKVTLQLAEEATTCGELLCSGLEPSGVPEKPRFVFETNLGFSTKCACRHEK